MNHAATIERFKTLDESSLRFIMNDCAEAIKANPDNPKCSQYQDELLYAAQEIQSRQFFIVGDTAGRHVECTPHDAGWHVEAILFTRGCGEKVLARGFNSRILTTRKGAERAAQTWLLKQQANQKELT